jgi:hypothetical protein
MKAANSLWLLIVLSICSCSNNNGGSLRSDSFDDSFPKALTPSEVLELPNEAYGDDVIVEGVLRFGPEYAGIWNASSDISEGAFRYRCVTVWDRDGILPGFVTTQARIVGTLLDAKENRIIVLGSCGDSRLVLVKEYRPN